jgi:hypothetical protein
VNKKKRKKNKIRKKHKIKMKKIKNEKKKQKTENKQRTGPTRTAHNARGGARRVVMADLVGV